jgi:hypothetical protein
VLYLHSPIRLRGKLPVSAYFPYYEEIKGGLWDHHDVCASVHTPHFLKTRIVEPVETAIILRVILYAISIISEGSRRLGLPSTGLHIYPPLSSRNST